MGFDLYDAVRAEQADKNGALVKQISDGNPTAKEELLRMFGQVDSSIFIPERRGHLKVVSDEKRRQVEKLLGETIVTLEDSSPRGIIIPENKIDFQTSQYTANTQSMSEAELSIFSALYFSDTQARDMFVSLFMQEKEHQGNNFKLDLNNLYEEIYYDEPTNIHSFGTTEIRDPVTIRLQRFFTGERKRIFKYEYSYAKVRRKHGTFGDSFFIRLSKVLLGHMGLRKTEVVDFPGTYQKSRTTPQEFQAKKLNPNTPEIVGKAFMSAMIELAHLSENIEWYIGVRKEIFIPDEIKNQFARMEELEVLGGLYNYHQHIESNLAMLIGYYYPEMVGKYGVTKGKNIEPVVLEKYPSLKDMNISSHNNSTIQSKKISKRREDTIILEMKEKVAEHFGFTDNRKLRCSPKLIEYILGLPDEEPVIFDIGGKKAQISAKMFRRVFHREGLPDTADIDNVIQFSKSV